MSTHIPEVPDTSVILVCAGNATRMQGIHKILMPLGDTNVIGKTMQAFQRSSRVAEIVLVTRPADHDAIRETAVLCGITKLSAIVPGGETRQQSVLCGLKAVSPDTALIAIHDGARPLVQTRHIDRVIQDAAVFGGATLGVPVKDTIKMVSGGLIIDTPDRSHLYLTQTPQAFQRTLYIKAVNFALAHNLDFTDDCQLVEALNHKVYMTEGDYSNIKITTPEDVSIAQILLERMEKEGAL